MNENRIAWHCMKRSDSFLGTTLKKVNKLKKNRNSAESSKKLRSNQEVNTNFYAARGKNVLMVFLFLLLPNLIYSSKS